MNLVALKPGVSTGPGERPEPIFRARARTGNRRANRARGEGLRAEFWENFRLNPKLARFLKIKIIAKNMICKNRAGPC